MDKTVKERRKAPLTTPTDLGDNARRDITGALNALLADVFALYLKTKNFHWHVSGPHFRDYHLLFDEQANRQDLKPATPPRRPISAITPAATSPARSMRCLPMCSLSTSRPRTSIGM